MRSPFPLPRKLRPGITLVELLGAATVLGLFLALAAPRLVASSSAADDGTHVILSALIQAQRLAVTHQRNVIVTFDIPERAVVIHLDEDHDGEWGPDERLTRLDIGDNVAFGPGEAAPRPDDAAPVTFRADAQGRPHVTFRRNGSVSEAGAIYLQVPDGSASESRLVTVSRATGRGVPHGYANGEWTPVGGRPR